MGTHEAFVRSMRALLLASLFVFVAACSVTTKARSMFGGMLPMQVTVDPHANEDAPLAVDLVVVYDQKLADDLLKLPAADWFSKRKQLLSDYPSTLQAHSWEWVPGQEVAPVSIDYHLGAKKVLLFADYGTEGEHRAAIDPQQAFRLYLGQHDLAVEAKK